ncbi:MAG TPA: hypothetical protein VLA92_01725 [Candidatus Saccharimonadales bacterium]|nr:hypothetical protein [Candidatus Saccharimonadales bacterium]
METSPSSFAQLPEQKVWEDVGIATETQLDQAADLHCREQVGAQVWDQMPYGRRRVHLLNTMYGEGGWNMVAYDEPGRLPAYTESMGMYPVEQPATFRIQRRLPLAQE